MAANIINGTHVKLNDGNVMPLLGLGTWQATTPDVSSAAVVHALQSGYRLLDTAYSYLNEEAVGAGIRAWGGDRQDVFVVTKLPGIALHATLVRRFLELSLKKLALDYVDLYLIHVPIGFQYVDDDTLVPKDPEGNVRLDFGTDHIAIWKEMEAVKAAGLTKSIGVSNFSPGQMRRLAAACAVPPAVNQVEMNVQFQQPEMQDYCREAGVTLMSYGTLGSPGRKGTIYESNNVIPSLLEIPVVLLVATAHSVLPAQVLLRYFVQKGIVVIPKSVTPARITLNSKIFDLTLSDTEMAALKTLDRGEEGRSFGFFFRNGLELHPECPVKKPAS